MEDILLNIGAQWYWLGPLLLGCLGVASVYLLLDMFGRIRDEIKSPDFSPGYEFVSRDI